MIRFPTTVAETVGGTVRAGGTDLMDRRKRGLHRGDLVDLRDVIGLDGLRAEDDGLLVGAMVRVQQLADHDDVRARWPLVAITAGGLATPQIRAVGTFGGNLLQATRCWYFRSPEFPCLRKGGSTCFARGGDHRGHTVFDAGPCVAVHASSLAMALRAYDDVTVLAEGSDVGTLEALLGEPGLPRDHTLPPGAVLVGVQVPPGWEGERAGYQRAISRFEAEWPLVEAGARVQVVDGAFARAAVVAGAVASVPMRLGAVEEALVGEAATSETVARAAERAVDGASALPGTQYKLDLLVQTVRTAVERALEAP